MKRQHPQWGREGGDQYVTDMEGREARRTQWPEAALTWYIPEQVTSSGWVLACPLALLSSILGIRLHTIMNV